MTHFYPSSRGCFLVGQAAVWIEDNSLWSLTPPLPRPSTSSGVCAQHPVFSPAAVATWGRRSAGTGKAGVQSWGLLPVDVVLQCQGGYECGTCSYAGNASLRSARTRPEKPTTLFKEMAVKGPISLLFRLFIFQSLLCLKSPLLFLIVTTQRQAVVYRWCGLSNCCGLPNNTTTAGQLNREERSEGESHSFLNSVTFPNCISKTFGDHQHFHLPEALWQQHKQHLTNWFGHNSMSPITESEWVSSCGDSDE